MTIEQLQKIAWLNRAYYADKKAKAWLAKQEQDKSLAERISRAGYGFSSGKSGNSTEDALIRLAETERKTQEKIAELVRIREEVTRAIEHVEDADMQSILIWHYLNYITFEQIADKMHYSLITIRRKHKKALDEIKIELV